MDPNTSCSGETDNNKSTDENEEQQQQQHQQEQNEDEPAQQHQLPQQQQQQQQQHGGGGADNKPSRDDLIELIRAIKFAKPDASQSQVHKEITQELSQKSLEFDFLKNVHIHDVKKVWKKAMSSTSTSTPAVSSANNTMGSSSSSSSSNHHVENNNNNQDLKEQLQSTGQPIQLFTVGMDNTNNPSSSTSLRYLAKEYADAYVAAQEALSQAEQKARFEDYVYVFLNVPADKSGSRPHQALIHFPKTTKNTSANSSTTTTTGGGAGTSGGGASTMGSAKAGGGGSNKKKNNKKKKGNAKPAATTTTSITTTSNNSSSTSSTATATTTTGNDGDTNNNNNSDNIVKIQMAAADGTTTGTTKFPMLIYNQSRTAKTFVHPTDEGYDRIQEWIIQKGIGGTLGARGGTKAYFYSNILPYKGSGGSNDILQIKVTELAPNQEW